MKLGFYVFLLTTVILPVNASVPKIGSGHNFINNELVYTKKDSRIKYDNNLGQVNLSIKVPLPHSFANIRKVISFKYSSQNIHNIGYGAGFTLSLPQIIFTKRTSRTNWLFDDGKSITELGVDRKGNFYEKELKNFLRFNKESKTITATYPNGRQLVFHTKSGLLKEEISIFKSANVKYEWLENRISKITLYNGRSIEFSYSECDLKKFRSKFSKLQVNKDGRWYDPKKCLSSVSYSQDRKLLFEYDSINLKKVFWPKVPGKPLFNAEYTSAFANEKEVHEEKHVSKFETTGNIEQHTRILRVGENKAHFLTSKQIAAKFNAVENELFNVYEFEGHNASRSVTQTIPVDFNNDGLTDVLEFARDHRGRVVEIDNDVVNNDHLVTTPGSGWSTQVVHLRLATYDTEKRKVVYPKGSSLKLNSNFSYNRPYYYFSTKVSDGHQLITQGSFDAVWEKCTDMYNSDDHGRCYDYSLGDKMESYLKSHSNILVGDFDGNNYQDVVICGEKNHIALNQRGKMFTFPSWGFTCERESIAQDINKDGFSDIITKSKILLGSPSGFITANSNNISPELKALQGHLITEGKEESQKALYGFKDINRDGVPDKKSANTNEVSSDLDKDGEIEIWKQTDGAGSFTIKKEMPLTPVLKKVYTAELGTMTIDYNITSGMLIASNIKYDALDYGSKKEVSVTYQKPIFNQLTNTFMGFGVSEQVIKGNDHEEGSRVIKQYYEDNVATDLARRSPRHGQLSKKYICPEQNCKSLAHVLAKSQTPKIDDWPFEESHDYKTIYSKSVKEVNFQEDSYFTYRSDSIKAQKGLSQNKMSVLNSVRHTLKVKDWSHLGPLHKETLIIENGMINHAGSNQLGRNYIKKIKKFKVINNTLLSGQEASFAPGNPEEKKISETNYNYDGTVGAEGFTVNRSIKINKRKSEEYIQTFNQFGVVKKNITPTELIINQDYDESTKSKTMVVVDDYEGSDLYILTTTFDDLGMLERSETSYDNGHNPEATGNNFSISRDETGDITGLFSQYNVYSITTDRSQTDGLRRQIDIMAKDNGIIGSQVSIFDGFGNKVNSSYNSKGKSLTSGLVLSSVSGKKYKRYASSFSENDENILKPTILSHSSLYDFKGRSVEEVDHITKRVDSYSYNGESVEHFINDKLAGTKLDSLLGLFYNLDPTGESPISGKQRLNGDVTLLNGLEYTRDLKGRITKVYNRKKQATLLSKEYDTRVITLDGSANIHLTSLGLIESISLGKNTEPIATYEYDGLGQLTYKNFSQVESAQSISYREDGHPIQVSWSSDKSSFKQNFELNADNTTKSTHIKIGRHKLQYEHSYQAVLLTELKPFIDQISYDKHGNLESLKYASGLKVQTTHNANGQLKLISNGSQTERYKLNTLGKIEKISGNLNTIQANSNQSFEYSDTEKISESPRLKGKLKRNIFYQAIVPDVVFANKKLSTIDSIEGKKVSHAGVESIVGVGKEKYLSDTLHFIKQHWIQYQKIGLRVVGAYISGPIVNGFFPILTDYRHSVRQVYDTSGNLIITRDYSTWGELTRKKIKTEESKLIDELIRLDFATLIRPYQSKYLISKSRVYSPAHGEWLTFDKGLLLKPESFVNEHLLETNGIAYTAGDPVNFVDPSGHNSMPVIVAGAALFATSYALSTIEYAKDMEYIETKIIQIDKVMENNKNNTEIQYQGNKAIKNLDKLRIARSIQQTKDMIKKGANPLDKTKPRLLKRIVNFIKELLDDESEILKEKADEIGDDFEDQTGKFLEADTETETETESPDRDVSDYTQSNEDDE